MRSPIPENVPPSDYDANISNTPSSSVYTMPTPWTCDHITECCQHFIMRSHHREGLVVAAGPPPLHTHEAYAYCSLVQPSSKERALGHLHTAHMPASIHECALMALARLCMAEMNTKAAVSCADAQCDAGPSAHYAHTHTPCTEDYTSVYTIQQLPADANFMRMHTKSSSADLLCANTRV